MNARILTLTGLALAAAALPAASFAGGPRVGISIAIGGPPVAYFPPPPVVFAPPPAVFVPPPAVFAPPPAVFVAQPFYAPPTVVFRAGSGWGHGQPRHWGSGHRGHWGHGHGGRRWH